MSLSAHDCRPSGWDFPFSCVLWAWMCQNDIFLKEQRLRHLSILQAKGVVVCWFWCLFDRNNFFWGTFYLVFPSSSIYLMIISPHQLFTDKWEGKHSSYLGDLLSFAYLWTFLHFELLQTIGPLMSRQDQNGWSPKNKVEELNRRTAKYIWRVFGTYDSHMGIFVFAGMMDIKNV